MTLEDLKAHRTTVSVRSTSRFAKSRPNFPHPSRSSPSPIRTEERTASPSTNVRRTVRGLLHSSLSVSSRHWKKQVRLTSTRLSTTAPSGFTLSCLSSLSVNLLKPFSDY